jgi:hypothetical protein
MRHSWAAATLSLLILAACGGAQVTSGPNQPAPPPGAAARVVPLGTQIVVELDETLNTDDNKVGDTFTATVKEDVSSGGRVIVPAGSKVGGIITGIDDSDRIDEQAAMRLAFNSITINGRLHAYSADITDVDIDVSDRTRIEEARKKAGLGAAAGAVLGAIIGGSLKDVLIGGVLGAGAGTIVSLGLGEIESALPRGTDMTLRTTSQVS